MVVSNHLSLSIDSQKEFTETRSSSSGFTLQPIHALHPGTQSTLKLILNFLRHTGHQESILAHHLTPLVGRGERLGPSAFTTALRSKYCLRLQQSLRSPPRSQLRALQRLPSNLHVQGRLPLLLVVFRSTLIVLMIGQDAVTASSVFKSMQLGMARVLLTIASETTHQLHFRPICRLLRL